ncbi:hypothetical protein OCH239_07860 [Roseivivax halodurans JCM 10272]|uniref:Lipoprotein n=1 Tax=Roseivivax halodurans JCM 10272 TaxID=1449350 RepID=X7EM54_9RHOB|nr:hypothetical protein [Roseivivax halodurans]ETX16256.1 hypothetical protein OCH239_07860 [Roseivivax halodurans JCM 10272]
MRHLITLASLLALTACAQDGIGYGVGGPDSGIRRVGDNILVQDAEGATLVIDENGCQSVMSEGSRSAQPVTDASGQQVCAGAEIIP